MGTSSTKAVIASPSTGMVLDRYSTGYTWTPGSSVTVEDYWAVISQELYRLQDVYTIRSIAVSTQMYSLIAPDGRVVGWNSPWTASSEQLTQWMRSLPGSGAQPDPIFPVFKLLDGADLLPFGLKAALMEKLTGTRAVDPAEASATGLYNVESQCWIDGFQPHFVQNEKLPEVVPHDSVVGTVTNEHRFRDSFQVVPGLGDGISASYRGWSQGSSAANLGTSVAVRTILPLIKGERNDQWRFRLDGDHVVYGGISRAGFGVFQRFRDAGYPVKQPVRNDRDLPLFFPWLEGIQWPLWDSRRTSSLLGFGPHHSLGEISAAVWQSVVYMVASMIEGITRDASCLVAGGGVLEQGFLEALAKCVTRELKVPEHAEFFAAEGAAQSALSALNANPLPEPTVIRTLSPVSQRDTGFSQWSQIAWRSE